MAGIGFTLRLALARGTLAGTARAYAVGAVVSSGPWVLSMLSLGVLGVLARALVGEAGLTLFFATVTHVFAFSLILTGPLQLVFTRYVADLLYLRRREAIFPAFRGALVVTTAGLGAIGLPFALALEVSPIYRVAALALFTVIGGIWVSMLCISAAKRYERIVAAFLAGSAVSVAGGWCGARVAGADGLLIGFLAGQAIILYGLIAVVSAEFPRTRGLSFEHLGHFRRHPALAAVGLAFNLAIWIDKILAWHHPESGVAVNGILRFSPAYDLPAYLAYVAVIPGLAFFVVRLETDFAEAYQGFFDRVVHRGTLGEIRAEKAAMVAALRDGVTRLIRLEGCVCLALVVFASRLVASLRLEWVHLAVLQVDLVGVLPQLLVLTSLTVLFYLDEKRSALLLASVFLAANAGGTALTLALGPTWYGYGMAGAALLAAVVGIGLVNRHLADLEFVTFMGQPVGTRGHEEPEPAPAPSLEAFATGETTRDQSPASSTSSR